MKAGEMKVPIPFDMIQITVESDGAVVSFTQGSEFMCRYKGKLLTVGDCITIHAKGYLDVTLTAQ